MGRIRGRMTRMRFTAAAVVLFLHSLECHAQVSELCKPTLAPRASGEQVADRGFSPPIPRPAFAPGTGPKVLFDEAHLNISQCRGPVRALRRSVAARRFRRGAESEPVQWRIAGLCEDPGHRERSPPRSAFSKREIDAVRKRRTRPLSKYGQLQ